MLRTLFTALFVATVLAACATTSPLTPPSSPPPALPGFDQARPPEPGQSRLYVFRPRSEDQDLHQELPVLYIGDTRIAAIPENGFAEIQLPPGRHTLSLVPPEGGSDLWRTRMTLLLWPDSVAYVPFWMAAGFERTSPGSESSDTVLLVLPVGNPEDTPAHLRIERSHHSVAEPILRQCCGRVFPPAGDAVSATPASPARRLLPVTE